MRLLDAARRPSSANGARRSYTASHHWSIVRLWHTCDWPRRKTAMKASKCFPHREISLVWRERNLLIGRIPPKSLRSKLCGKRCERSEYSSGPSDFGFFAGCCTSVAQNRNKRFIYIQIRVGCTLQCDAVKSRKVDDEQPSKQPPKTAPTMVQPPHPTHSGLELRRTTLVVVWWLSCRRRTFAGHRGLLSDGCHVSCLEL